MKYIKTTLITAMIFLSLFLGFLIPPTSVYSARSIELSLDYNLETTVELSCPIDPPANGKGEHWAIVIGISDYKAIGDLNFCDDDANDWYLYLTALGYEHILVLGDNSNYYYQYDGLATEYNVKQALYSVVSNAGMKDSISFITSGHGSTAGKGASLLCMWDYSMPESGEDGRFWDYELASILELAVAEQIFVFIDHCFAGGFGPELLSLSNSENIYFAAACTDKGMGWDAPEFTNGLWTYYFLEFTLIDYFKSNPRTTMEEAFDYASANFKFHTGVMIPEEYDGDLDEFFLLI